ncbi:VOC family protein [Culicoidibacter larvae]|uniref:VOC family protein n=1 Tax=Culicoidibacter larvae TaxID=2579976 RepID=A0A5R8Q9B6_9FIRM|nr:VOC family protein [Culicoidibacter larvae]TLG72506.1 VOC family protein [Culicoidibacter larvae]
MLVTHIYFNGQCKEAIELYKQALNASVETLIEDPEHSLVIHAEMLIDNKPLIVNDFGNDDGYSKSGGYQLCVQFDDEAALLRAYEIMQNGSTTIESLQPTDYSPCTVRFIDMFDVRWAFWV